MEPQYPAHYNEWQRSKLQSVGVEEMEIILSYLYTGTFEEIEDRPLLEDLLGTSHFLQMEGLFEYCYKKLSESMTSSNFLDMCNLVSQFDDEGMTAHVLSFVAQNFEDVSKSEEFLKLDEYQMQKICRHTDIRKSLMDVVVGGLFRWTEIDEDREKTLLQILTKLDLKRMSTEYLSETLREQDLVKKNYHILTLLTAEATSRMLTLSSKSLDDPQDPKLLTFGGEDDQQVFRTYYIQKNQWSQPKRLPFHLEEGMSIVWFDGLVYIIGGGDFDNTRPSSRVIKYCYATNTVSSCGSLLEPVRYAGIGVLNGYIYVVNGLNDNGDFVSTVQRYNPLTGTCEMIADTNKPHYLPHVMSCGKNLLVLGSATDNNSVEHYDPEFNKWTLITDIPGKIDWCSAAIYKKKLFIVPTYETSEFQIYHFSSDTWEQKQFDGSPGSIYGLYSTVIEGKRILLVLDGEGILHSFNPKSLQWQGNLNPNIDPWVYWHSCIL